MHSKTRNTPKTIIEFCGEGHYFLVIIVFVEESLSIIHLTVRRIVRKIPQKTWSGFSCLIAEMTRTV
jgi:hypothetical protein